MFLGINLIRSVHAGGNPISGATAWAFGVLQSRFLVRPAEAQVAPPSSVPGGDVMPGSSEVRRK